MFCLSQHIKTNETLIYGDKEINIIISWDSNEASSKIIYLIHIG